jgi:SAM-dependent methyltransferase
VTDYAPDGSPVKLYLRVSGAAEAALIDAELSPASSVLELGCGAGRITHELTRLGHQVTGVDNSPDMLAHVHDADTVLADIVGLDLGRTFDAVILWSHFVNTPDPVERDGFLATCRRHVARDGVVLVGRHARGWVTTATPKRQEHDGIVSDFRVLSRRGDHLRAAIVWEFDGERFEQVFDTVDIDDDAMATLASRHSLVVTKVLEPDGVLVRLEVAA